MAAVSGLWWYQQQILDHLSISRNLKHHKSPRSCCQDDVLHLCKSQQSSPWKSPEIIRLLQPPCRSTSGAAAGLGWRSSWPAVACIRAAAWFSLKEEPGGSQDSSSCNNAGTCSQSFSPSVAEARRAEFSLAKHMLCSSSNTWTEHAQTKWREMSRM